MESIMEEHSESGHNVNVNNIKIAIQRHLRFTLGLDRDCATKRDLFTSLAYTIADHQITTWIKTRKLNYNENRKHIFFLSMEFCIGRAVTNTAISTGIAGDIDEALFQLGLDIEELVELEAETSLEHSGVGGIAACLLDSLATMGYAATGYGIRYEYGLSKQDIKDGWEINTEDNALQYGNPWEKVQFQSTVPVNFHGYVCSNNFNRYHWINTNKVNAIPHDTPITGYLNKTCLPLRLWSAKPSDFTNHRTFNDISYMRALCDQSDAERISRVLYPIFTVFDGMLLRLKQEYFLVSASVQDIIKQFKSSKLNIGKQNVDFTKFPNYVAIHLNGASLALAIPELMRILLDEEKLHWDTAWEITIRTFSFTCYSVNPDTLERWPVNLLQWLLPRHLDIIYFINHLFLENVIAMLPDNLEPENVIDCIRNLSTFSEEGEKLLIMTHLCIIGSHAVNCTSDMHSKIFRNKTFKYFYDLWPDKFQTITCGITPRRWLLVCNPRLANHIVTTMGKQWITNLELITEITSHSKDEKFMHELRQIKLKNKAHFAVYLEQTQGIKVECNHMFDVQMTRIEEHKRQLLNCLHVITLYNRLKANPTMPFIPRTVFIGGKAAPSSCLARKIIKLITSVSQIINSDNNVNKRLKLIFIKNYSNSLAEKIIPAADLSEQIAAVESDASGTSNIKFMLNGALTIGSMTGSNLEMFQEVGSENCFTFGHTSDTLGALLFTAPGYIPADIYHSNSELHTVLNQIRDGFFNPEDRGLFLELFFSLIYKDHFMVLADYEEYVACQQRVSATYHQSEKWSQMVLKNIASAGKFSSDRSVFEYAHKMWGVNPSSLR